MSRLGGWIKKTQTEHRVLDVSGNKNAFLFKTASLPSASIQATEKLGNFPIGGSTY